MIVDQIENAARYHCLGERIALALASIRTPREPGRYELDGDKLIVIAERYQTKPLAQGKWEAHRRYIDVQYVVEGAERIGWSPVGNLTVSELYDEARDIAFYLGSGSFITVPAGSFMILFPEDAHMPCLAVDEPAPVSKIVVKVRVA